MDINQLAIAIRPRSAWQAVDLGLKMGHRWWWSLVKIWLTLTFPLIVLSNLLPVSYSWIPLVVYWWCKPLWERPLLYAISLEIFGQPVSLKQSLKQVPSLFKHQLFASLLWRRLSLKRSFIAPIHQLEGLSGQKSRQRTATLQLDGSSAASWTTLIFVHMESMLLIGAFLMLYSLLPKEVELDWLDLPNLMQTRFYNLLNSLFYWGITAAIAPFYVACGFAIYLNRRIALEAWDIEIAFRQLLARYKPLFSSLLLMITLAIPTLPSMPASAAEMPASELAESAPLETPANISRQAISEQITAIKSGKDFHNKQQITYPKWRWPATTPQKATAMPEWLLTLFSRVASAAEVIIWLVVITLIFIVAVKFRVWQARFRGLGTRRQHLHFEPTRTMGLDINRDSLPDDVGAEALKLIQSGQTRAGIALLYRASLAQLVARGLALSHGMTEGDCLQQVTHPSNPLSLPANSQDYFIQLTRIWRQLAYGHGLPVAAQTEPLCHHWQQAWQL